MNRRDFIKASTALALTPLLSPFTFGDTAIGKEWVVDWCASEWVLTLDDIGVARKRLLTVLGQAYKAGGFTRWADVRIEAHREVDKGGYLIVAVVAFR